mgnify:CR=1 FL=1
MSQISLGTWESLVLGMRCKDGVILAGTKKVSYGYLVVSQQAGRAVDILDNVGFAFAGHVADLQNLLRTIKIEINYLKYTLGRPLSISAIANRLGLILYSYKLFPYITFALIGGVDKYPEKPRLFSLDPVGSVIEEEYAASGISAEVAIGLLEDRYSPDMSVDDAKELALDVMRAVARRDVLAGKYVDLAVITREKSELQTITLKI